MEGRRGFDVEEKVVEAPKDGRSTVPAKEYGIVFFTRQQAAKKLQKVAVTKPTARHAVSADSSPIIIKPIATRLSLSDGASSAFTPKRQK